VLVRIVVQRITGTTLTTVEKGLLDLDDMTCVRTHKVALVGILCLSVLRRTLLDCSHQEAGEVLV
jgi:hypothetical protein